jgi:uncharacterized repeat protein (TIGR03803 family)
LGILSREENKMNAELRGNKQICRDFLRSAYNDERLAMLLAHAQSGKLVYHSCCCFAGVSDARHNLRVSIDRDWEGHDEHLRGPKADISDAYCSLAPDSDSFDKEADAKRRRLIVPIIRAEMRRRDRAKQAAEWKAELVRVATLVLAMVMLTVGARAETVLYRFGPAPDGETPNGNLLIDSAGNIYGTTLDGGNGFGTVYEATQAGQESVLYAFCPGGAPSNCPDGSFPSGGVVMDAQGDLWGMTSHGGALGSYGVLFELMPSDGGWAETTVWSFGGEGDGRTPVGGLAMDAAGNLYGAMADTVSSGMGGIVEWSNEGVESLLYTFCVGYPDCDDDGWWPTGVAVDGKGDLWGTTQFGGTQAGEGMGVLWELAAGAWQESVLYDFHWKGGRPLGSVSFDGAGNAYGSLSVTNTNGGCGGIFRQTAQTTTVLTFNETGNGCGPVASVYVSNALYGTGMTDGPKGAGTVFKVTAGGKVGVVYAFCSEPGCEDGSGPGSGLVPYGGMLYGTTTGGGNGWGVVFAVKP